MSDDSHCIGKEPCPQCGSRDNLARYSDGHGYCFGCKYHENGDGTAAPAPTNRRSTLSLSMIPGEVTAIPARGINEETCRKWGYMVGTAPHPKTKKDEPCQIATYCDDAGVPVAQKIRWRDKTFQFVGDPKKATLYGKHLWRDGGKKVVITEGEIDALTVSQLQSNKWPVVSLANGASSAKKALSQNLEWLLGFDEVVLMFDDDEPGRAAVEECAPLFPAGKCKVARIDGHKDANEALTAGHGARVIDATWSAKEYRPDGVVGIADIIDRASARIEYSPMTWPWPTLQGKTYGRRFTEMYGLAAGTGMGKTTLYKQLQGHVILNDVDPVGVFALEEPSAHAAKTLAGVLDGVRYHVPGVEYDDAKLRARLEWMDGKVYFYDHQGGASYETVIDKMRYMRHAYGVRHFFLDNLTALASMIEGDNERKVIDTMMKDLASLMIELDACLYFISHLTTPEGKSHEEGGRVKENQFRGSRSIAFWSHLLLALEGDKQKPGSPRTLRVLKDRFTGDANGLAFGLMYDKETGHLVECDLTEEPRFRDESSNEF